MNRIEILAQYAKDKNLYGADLRCANLYGADLRSADLSGADLRCADLYGADLRCADLRCADLPTSFRICRIDFGGWSVCITPIETTIGCQKHPNTDWLKWNPADVSTFADGAKEWWAQHSAVIKAAIKDVQKGSK